MQEECNCERDTGRKPATRQVMTAQEQMYRQHDDDREEPLHDNRRHGQIIGQCFTCLAVGCCLVISILNLLLGSRSGCVGRRTETAQERKDRKPHNAEDGDFAKSIESAEVDQNDVHDIFATAA